MFFSIPSYHVSHNNVHILNSHVLFDLSYQTFGRVRSYYLLSDLLQKRNSGELIQPKFHYCAIYAHIFYNSFKTGSSWIALCWKNNWIFIHDWFLLPSSLFSIFVNVDLTFSSPWPLLTRYAIYAFDFFENSHSGGNICLIRNTAPFWIPATDLGLGHDFEWRYKWQSVSLPYTVLAN